jgi:stalled ribosome rescue protein Dom34
MHYHRYAKCIDALPGSAAFCLLSQHMTVVRQRIDIPVPRKQASSTAHEKGLEKFYQTLYTTFLRHIPYADSSMRAIVIASPGWVRDAVLDYIIKEATRTGNKTLLSVRNKFIKVHVTSPHVHSLVEVLKSPEVSQCLSAICPLINLVERSLRNSRRPNLLEKASCLISETFIQSLGRLAYYYQ